MRRTGWLLGALALLLLGAWLSSLAETHPPPRTRPAVAFPSRLRPHEWERLTTRRTLVVQASIAPVGPAAPEEPERRDPFLAALPVRPGDPVVVFEANALRHSRLGERFVECALARDPRAFDELQREIGIDVLKDVDRVAFVGESVVVSGFFQRLDPAQIVRATGAEPRRVGEAGVVYGDETATPGPGRLAVGTWRDQLVVVSEDAAHVRRAIDQLEGRAAPPEVELPDGFAYGEVYGIVPGAALRRLLRDDRELLADRLASAAQRIELHVDAMGDVAAVARFQGDDASALSDLARAMGGVLAAARLHAQVNGDRILAELLDQASVSPGDGLFTVNVALPFDRVERWFAGCGR